jgi:NlpC/P60 family putative phage cell wall peptidase
VATQEAIVQEALTWRGTPYHHAADLKHIGCDCVGLLIGVAKAVGILDHAWHPGVYSPQWHVHKSQQLLQETMESLGCMPIPIDDRHPGTIVVFQFGRVISHAGILVSRDPDYLVHALLHQGVKHHRLAGDLLNRLRGGYTFPAVINVQERGPWNPEERL